MKLAIIGAGASGMFCASNLSENIEIVIFEMQNAPLKKVLQSGGGRCNFTNVNIDGKRLEDFYPRGAKNLKRPLKQFGAKDTQDFFQDLGVYSKIEDNGRVFPISNDAYSITRTLIDKAMANSAKILTNTRVKSISKNQDGSFSVETLYNTYDFDAVLIATGGSLSKELKESLSNMDIDVTQEVPSLFSLKIDTANSEIWQELSGTTIQEAQLSYKVENPKAGEPKKIVSKGSLLLTHFGIGGPATLKLSSFGAKNFAEADYNFKITINFAPKYTFEQIRELFQEARIELARRQINNAVPFDFTQKFWDFVCDYSNVDKKTIFANLSKKDELALIDTITQFQTNCIGRSIHQTEFVTCGGVKRSEIDFSTMQSNKVKNLFFTGECIDIDAITGGFNLQSAWTTGKICANFINTQQ